MLALSREAVIRLRGSQNLPCFYLGILLHDSVIFCSGSSEFNSIVEFEFSVPGICSLLVSSVFICRFNLVDFIERDCSCRLSFVAVNQFPWISRMSEESVRDYLAVFSDDFDSEFDLHG